MQLRPDAGAAQPQIGELQRWNQHLRWLEKRFDRQAAALVVVLAILEARRRTERDVAVDRLAEMRAEAVRVRQRVDERVHQMSFRRNQLRILAAAGIDAERRAAERR